MDREQAIALLKRNRLVFTRIIQFLLAYAASYGATFFLSATEPTFVSVFVFAGLLCLQLARRERPSRRIMTVSACVSAFYSLCIFLYNYHALGRDAGFFSLRSALVLVGCWALFFVPFCSLYQRWCSIRSDTLTPSGAQLKRLFWISFCTMLLAWLPMYLMYFPGHVCADTTDQLYQIVNNTRYNHHPYLHTLVMKAVLYTGVAIFKTQNGAIAFYCVLQMVFFALLLAYVIYTMRMFGAKKWFCVLTLLFFALEPNVMYRCQVVEKDSTFSWMIMLFVIALWRLIVFTRRGDSVKAHWKDAALLCVGALGFCSMRSNGFYTFLPLTVILLFALDKRLRIVKYICVSSCALMMSYLLLLPVLGITNVDTIEALSIPLQQVSRVIYDGGDITDEELALLDEILDTKQVQEWYAPYTSDHMKYLVGQRGQQAYLKEHAVDYLKLWLRIGIRNPRLYLYAFIDETCGYWEPQYISPRVHYNDVGDMKDYIVNNHWGYYADPILPDSGIRIVQGWMVIAKQLPILAMFRSIGTATWLAVAVLGAAVVRRQRYSLLLHAPYACLFAVLMATTPYNFEYRYLFPLFVALPLLFSVSLYGEGIALEMKPQ